MADTDRRTTIDGDQITDDTISVSELKKTNSPTSVVKYITVDPNNPDQFEFVEVNVDSIQSFSIGGSKQANSVNNIYLSHFDGSPYNVSQFVVPYAATIVAISASVRSTNNAWTAQVRKSLNTTPIASLAMSESEQFKYDSTLSVDVDAGDTISIYALGTIIRQPRVDVFFKKR